MTGWLDAYLLPVLIGLPVLGAFFVAVMPGSDRLTLRHAGMGAAATTGLVALYAASRVAAPDGAAALALPLGPGGQRVLLALEAADLPALLSLAFGVPLCLRAGAPRILERTQGYVVLMLLAEALALGAVLAKTPLLALALLDCTTFPLLLLLGAFGGPFRGSASLRVGLLWLTVDAAALAAAGWLAAQTPMGAFADLAALREAGAALSPARAALALAPLWLAGAMRLGVVPLSAWLPEWLEEAPVSAASLIAVLVMPLGALTMHRYGNALPAGALELLGFSLSLSAASGLLAGAQALVERDLRRLVAAAAALHGAVAAFGLASLSAPASAAALVLVPAMGTATAFALFVTDALERRYLVRDSAELIGVALQLPGLWRLSAFALVSLVGVPALAGGGLLLDVLGAGAAAPAVALAGLPPNAALWAVGALTGGWALLAAGALATLKRLTSPPLRQPARDPSPLTLPQSLRLWVPAVLVLAAGLSAPLLAGRVEREEGRAFEASAEALSRARPALPRLPPAAKAAFPEVAP